MTIPKRGGKTWIPKRGEDGDATKENKRDPTKREDRDSGIPKWERFKQINREDHRAIGNPYLFLGSPYLFVKEIIRR